jgi:bifunctional DNA-binding transcriptional regulator/antitoxin component of YhaV-PrlF toxin-antitoxin module
VTPIEIRERYGYAAGDVVEVAAGPDGLPVNWNLPVTRARVFGYGHDIDETGRVDSVTYIMVIPTGPGVRVTTWEIRQFDRIRKVEDEPR